mmetsp:Transcript_13186/g.57508  ORF Transcript_13186/g.57508 Transcript_13186/m.57508 type:complete len:237 (+) Transcript_13186:868-1578(+)
MAPAASSAAAACCARRSRSLASSRSSSSSLAAASATFLRSRAVSVDARRESLNAESLAACAASAATLARMARSTASSRSVLSVSTARSIFSIAARASRSRRRVTSRSSAKPASVEDGTTPETRGGVGATTRERSSSRVPHSCVPSPFGPGVAHAGCFDAGVSSLAAHSCASPPAAQPSSSSSLRCLASCFDADARWWRCRSPPSPVPAMAGCTLARSSCTGGSATCVMGERVSGRL